MNDVNVIDSGGGTRTFFGKTAFGDYHIAITRNHSGPIFDADGNELGSLDFTIKTPPAPPPRVLDADQKQRMAARMQVCGKCEHLKSFGMATVKCAKCTTCRNALSLISPSSACPEGRWEA